VRREDGDGSTKSDKRLHGPHPIVRVNVAVAVLAGVEVSCDVTVKMYEPAAAGEPVKAPMEARRTPGGSTLLPGRPTSHDADTASDVGHDDLPLSSGCFVDERVPAVRPRC